MKTKITSTSDCIKILRHLQRFGYQSAIIAGGAIRDSYMGRTISDYDIFLWDPRSSDEKLNGDPRENDFEEARTFEFTQLLGISSITQRFDTAGYTVPAGKSGVGAQLTSIWEAEIGYDIYQLIYTHIHPVQHVSKYFDFGICKAYCDGTKFSYTADFMHDIKNNVLTMVGEDMTPEQFAYALEYHAGKILRKYPGFNLSLAPHNLELFLNYWRIHK